MSGKTTSWWPPLVVFTVVALAVPWLIASPLIAAGGTAESPFFMLVALSSMFAPLVASLIAAQVVRKQQGTPIVTQLACWPLKPVGKILRYVGIAIGGTFVMALLMMLSAIAFGFSRFNALGPVLLIEEQVRQQAEATGQEIDTRDVLGPLLDVPPAALGAILIVQMLIGSVFNAVAAAGEELGWRGWLHSHLSLRLPLAGVIVVTGILWGVWHAPVLALGYNYPNLPLGPSIAMMTGMCILLSALYAWLRERTGSVWPAVFAHGALNAMGTLPMLFTTPGPLSASPVIIGFLGFSGWLVLALAVVLVYLAWPVRRTTTPANS